MKTRIARTLMLGTVIGASACTPAENAGRNQMSESTRVLPSEIDALNAFYYYEDVDAAWAFYRDVLGFRYEAALDMPGGTTMHRMWCGDSLIKVLQHKQDMTASAPAGGIAGGTGYRYWTITVGNLDAAAARCEEAGCKIPVTPREIRPGVKICMVEDPDGNWVELLENS